MLLHIPMNLSAMKSTFTRHHLPCKQKSKSKNTIILEGGIHVALRSFLLYFGKSLRSLRIIFKHDAQYFKRNSHVLKKSLCRVIFRL
mmetsp:Transcript_10507/g.22905  ORF Transcript_10507/g.22905 Transcript_10507/m.22905 type:complete len:87 (+) Transcript_10507:788-1048(+)